MGKSGSNGNTAVQKQDNAGKEKVSLIDTRR